MVIINIDDNNNSNNNNNNIDNNNNDNYKNSISIQHIKWTFLFFKQASGDHSLHYQFAFTSLIICNNNFIKMILSTQSN